MNFEKIVKWTSLKKWQTILTPGIRWSLGGGLFGRIWLFFYVFSSFFLKILSPGIRRSLGGSLFWGSCCFLVCFSSFLLKILDFFVFRRTFGGKIACGGEGPLIGGSRFPNMPQTPGGIYIGDVSDIFYSGTTLLSSYHYDGFDFTYFLWRQDVRKLCSISVQPHLQQCWFLLLFADMFAPSIFT